MEGLALHARQREDRQIDDGDYRDAEQARADHFGRGDGGEVEALVAAQQAAEPSLRLAKAAQHVLDDDHRTVDDQPEVEGAEAHQIPRDAVGDHAADRQQHRQRNDRRRDQRGADVAEQQEQHRNDQQRAFEEVLFDRPDRRLDQRRAVIDWVGDDACRQRLVDLGQPRGDRDADIAAVLADQHEDRTEHDLAPILGRGTVPQFAADDDIGDVGDTDWNTVPVRDDDAAEVVLARDLPRDTDQILGTRTLDIARPDVGVIEFQRIDDGGDPEPVGRETIRVGRNVVFFTKAADAVDFGNAGYGAQLRANDPIVQGSQILRRIGRSVGLACAGFGLDRVHEDLAEPRSDRAEFGLQPRRQLGRDGLDALPDELACEVEVGAVLEDHGDLAQPVARHRTRVFKAGESGDGSLDRIGDALFGFERREAGCLGVDLYLDVGDVGHRVDRQATEIIDAERREREDDAEHQPAAGDRKADDAFEHGGS